MHMLWSHAGYFFATFAKHWLQDGRMDTLEIAAGLIGPSARGGWNWDVLPRVATSLGSPFTQASASIEARFGWNLPNELRLRAF